LINGLHEVNLQRSIDIEWLSVRTKQQCLSGLIIDRIAIVFRTSVVIQPCTNGQLPELLRGQPRLRQCLGIFNRHDNFNRSLVYFLDTRRAAGFIAEYQYGAVENRIAVPAALESDRGEDERVSFPMADRISGIGFPLIGEMLTPVG